MKVQHHEDVKSVLKGDRFTIPNTTYLNEPVKAIEVEYLNMSDTAKYLKISRTQLYNLIKQGKINKPMKIANHPVYSLKYLQQFLRNSIKC